MEKKSQLKNLIKTESSSNLSSYFVAISVLISCVLIVGVVFLELGRTYYTDKSAPGQTFESYNVSGITSLEAQTYIQSILNTYLTKTVEFDFNDKQYLVAYQDLGLTTDFNLSYQQIKFYKGKPTRTQFLKDQFGFTSLKAKTSLDVYDLESNLVSLIPNIAKPKPASFQWSELALVISPEKMGNNTNFDQVRREILTNKDKIKIPFEIKIPSVLSLDLEPIKLDFEKSLSQPITLSYSGQTFPVNLGENPGAVVFSHGKNHLIAELDPAYLDSYLDENVISKIESEPETLKLTLASDNKVEFDKTGKSGFKINQKELANAIDDYLTETILLKQAKSATIEITGVVTDPILVIDPALEKKGIKELVSVGYTTYHGSPANRIHNINVGTEIYNGMIIPKGKTFSFNKELGRVDASTGYLPELVIKAEGTIPEYGGGICQVSTTIYRGVLYGGFKVSERYNHSYTVGYYAQVLGHGLDATIYPGSKDFQFVNDTPSDLVVQAFTEGTTMTVRFYGTNDERKVELIGPKVLSSSGAGAPVYVVNNDFSPGTVKQVASGVPGLSTEWIRKITFQDGTVVEEPIISRFRSVSPKYITGPAISTGPTI